ncbi:MAG: glycosyltransferase family 2 protein [Acidobacteriota bacterium]
MTLVSYILPLRSWQPPTREFMAYVNQLAAVTDMIIVDGSDDALFAELDRACLPGIRHVRPAPELHTMKNGKVQGVLTGLTLARSECVVIADDDVRYSVAALDDIASSLAWADVVRPQNYFDPLPWHARLDTARTLINRVAGGDWPGTLAVRLSTMRRLGGYDGDVLFENLELVRTVEAAGGKAVSRPELLVRRLPPSTHHFWSQRVRQAYDEFARPARLGAALAVIPMLIASW